MALWAMNEKIWQLIFYYTSKSKEKTRKTIKCIKISKIQKKHLKSITLDKARRMYPTKLFKSRKEFTIEQKVTTNYETLI